MSPTGASDSSVEGALARVNLGLALAAASLSICLFGLWLGFDWLQNDRPHDTLMKVLAPLVVLSGGFAFERADGASRAARTDDPYPTGVAASVQKKAKLARRMALLALSSPVWCAIGLVALVFLVGNVAR